MAGSARQFLDWLNRHPFLRRAMTRLIVGDRNREVPIFGLPLLINTLEETGYYRASRFCQKSSLLRDEMLVCVPCRLCCGVTPRLSMPGPMSDYFRQSSLVLVQFTQGFQ